ncbi:hypothetical protein NEOLEDRAFT_1242388 [Neolentinus lepideus HHB14362 ss-1]|uniref:Uncharacterized protein n=1 Tax=Neolentinus lepideus HHB14362 ss-1 TaxID=1314782 RepID=A0A165RYQ8_9AGAM|nr:hypothetical protein NEOLEDRAFT_1242388 [Neolentinus lepideus HHB14362 ss-1]
MKLFILTGISRNGHSPLTLISRWAVELVWSNMALEPLNSPNLRKVGSRKLSRDCFVAKYVKEQRTYISGYTCNSRSVLVPVSGVSRNDDKEPLAPGFATPVLKPRVPPSHTKDLFKPVVPSGLSSKPESCTAAKLSRKMVVESSKPDVSRTGVETTNSPKPCSARPPRKRAATPDSGEERNARLAERRGRKRSKKAITQPKIPEDLSEHSDEGAEVSQPDRITSKIKSRGKKKESKKLKVPAGLALMNGFSAKNLGKNRLTLKPVPQSGVFNKGKASMKVGVTRKIDKRVKGLEDSMFSEFRFLNNKSKIPEGSRKKKKVSLVESCSELSSVQSGAPIEGMDTDVGHPHTNGKLKDRSIKKAQDPSEMSSASVPSAADKMSEPPQPQGPGSVVWDIEVEGRSLPVDASSVSLSSHTPEGTVTLNIPILQCPLDQGINIEPETEQIQMNTSTNTRDLEDVGKTGKVSSTSDARSSSIGPSESASQAHPMLPKNVTLSGAVSKYFPHRLIPPIDTKELYVTASGPIENPEHAQVIEETCWSDIPHLVPIEPSGGTHIGPESLHAMHVETHSLLLDVNLPEPINNVYLIPQATNDPELPVQCLVSPSLSADSLDLALQTYEADRVLRAHLPPRSVDIQGREPYECRAPEDREAIDLAYHQYNYGDYDVGAADADAMEDIGPWRPDSAVDLDHTMDYSLEHTTHDVGVFATNWQYTESLYADSLVPDEGFDDEVEYLMPNYKVPLAASTSLTPERSLCMEHLAMDSLDCDDEECNAEFALDQMAMDDNILSDTGSQYDCEARPQTPYSQVTQSSDIMSSILEETDDQSLLPLFSEGRSLLLGLYSANNMLDFPRVTQAKTAVSKAEKDVAKSLKDHWFPQKL